MRATNGSRLGGFDDDAVIVEWRTDMEIVIRRLYYLVNTLTDRVDDQDYFTDEEVAQANAYFEAQGGFWEWMGAHEGVLR